MFDEILIFGALGILAGLLAGMFGFGGGLIIVPVLIGTFLSLDLRNDSLYRVVEAITKKSGRNVHQKVHKYW